MSTEFPPKDWKKIREEALSEEVVEHPQVKSFADMKAEHAAKTKQEAKETPAEAPTRTREELKEEMLRVRQSIRDLEERAKHSRSGGLPQNLEPEILAQEALLRKLEKEPVREKPQQSHEDTKERIKKEREIIRDLENRAKVSHVNGIKQNLEPDILAHEDELRRLERLLVENSKAPTSVTTERTPGEARADLPGMVFEIDTLTKKSEAPKELGERAGITAERAAMKTAEDAYFAAYKDFHAKNNTLMRLGKEKLNTKSARELATLKQAYDLSRVAYAQALDMSSQKRYAERQDAAYEAHLKRHIEKGLRYGTPEDLEGTQRKDETAEQYRARMEKRKGLNLSQAERNAAVLARYNRLVRFNEIIKPGADKEIAARKEALGKKGEGLFNLFVEKWKKDQVELEGRYGKYGAQVVRSTAFVLLGTAAGAASGVGLASLALGGGLRLARAFTMSAISGVTGGGVFAKAYELGIGRKKVAEAQQALENERVGKTGRYAMGSLNTADLARIDAARKNSAAWSDERTLARNKAIAQVVASFGISGGVGLASLLSDLSHTSDVIEGVSKAADHHTPNTAPGVGAPAEGPSQVSETAPSKVEDVDVVKGEGAIKMFQDFKEHLAKAYEGKTPPSEVQKVLTMQPTEAARAFGFYDPNGGPDHTSATLHVGDALTVNEKGEVVFVPKSGTPTVLESGDPSKHYQGPWLSSREHTPSVTARTTEDGVDMVYGYHDAQIPAEPTPENPRWLDSANTAQERGSYGSYAPSPDGEAPPQYVNQSVEAPVNAANGPIEPPEYGVQSISPNVGEHAASSLESGDVFVNKHNISINPAEPAAYSYMYKGERVIFVSGGGATEDGANARIAFIETKLAADPNMRGARILWDTAGVPNGPGFHEEVGQFKIGERGDAEFLFSNPFDEPIPVPDKDLIDGKIEITS